MQEDREQSHFSVHTSQQSCNGETIACLVLKCIATISRLHLVSGFLMNAFMLSCFHAIIAMRQVAGLEIQNTVAFPPISSCLPDYLNIFFYGIRYAKMAHPFHIWAVVATTTISGPSMGAKLCKTFVFKASGVLL